ncbi:MAG: response regulator transcription factor [Dehalococcoidia bacterium]|nr:response regulator transcription factor [Dehalococcoidia bacterium]
MGQSYISKSAAVDEIVEAVQQVAEGKIAYSPHLSGRILSGYRKTNGHAALSSRELQVLRLLSTGLTNTEIAARLFIGESTVRTYFGRIMEKLRLRNRSELIAFAVHYQFDQGNGDHPSPDDGAASAKGL